MASTIQRRVMGREWAAWSGTGTVRIPRPKKRRKEEEEEVEEEEEEGRRKDWGHGKARRCRQVKGPMEEEVEEVGRKEEEEEEEKGVARREKRGE
jgi:hypothetical protein